VQLVGDSMQALRELAEDVVPILSRRPELRDVRLDVGDQVSELAVRVDRERAAAFGFSADQVAGFVGLALRGSQLREYRRGQNEVPVWVRFAGAENFDHSDIATFMVRAPDGRTVPLMSMVDISIEPAANRITRTDRQTSLAIQANLAGQATTQDARRPPAAAPAATAGPAWPCRPASPARPRCRMRAARWRRPWAPSASRPGTATASPAAASKRTSRRCSR